MALHRPLILNCRWFASQGLLFGCGDEGHNVIQYPRSTAQFFHTDALVIAMFCVALFLSGGVGRKSIGIDSQRTISLVFRVSTGESRHHRSRGEILLRHLPDGLE